MLRRLAQAAALSALVMGASSCDLFSSSSSAAPPVATVSTDLARLRSLVTLPTGVTSARWLVHPVGSTGTSMLPGPTDTVLIAYLETEPNFWNDNGFLFPVKNKPVVRLRATDAKALLPEALLQKAQLSGDEYQLTGCEARSANASNPATGTATRRAIMAASCGSALLIAFRGQ